MNLVPLPRKIEKLAGVCRPESRFARLGVAGGKESLQAVRHKLGEMGFRVRADGSLPAGLVLIGETNANCLAPPYQPEGYALLASARGVAVAGHDADGLYWGLVTLQQLLDGRRSCPSVRITDWPAFGYRAHMDDISRRQVSTLEDFKRIIRLLSCFKIKYYSPYIEDMLEIGSFPDIGIGRGRLTAREVREMVRYAKLHNVVVYPTYSLFGHQENLLSLPAYRKFAREVFQPPSAYDVTKPGLRPYLRKVIRDVCGLFPDALIFNGCFDEVLGPSKAQFISHANWCAAEVAKHGKRLMLYLDMFKNHYGLDEIRRLDGRIMPVEWDYEHPLEREEPYRKAGFIPWGHAAYWNWCSFLPDFACGKKNIDEWAVLQTRWGGPGFSAAQYGDHGSENSRDLCWNLFAYYGETAWSGRPAAADFERRFQRVFYGRSLAPLDRVLDSAAQRAIAPRDYWKYFRMNVPAMVRMAAAKPDVVARIKCDLVLHERSLRNLAAAKRSALREGRQLDHFTVAVERERNVCRRMLLAAKIAAGLSGRPLRKALEREIAELKRVRKLHEKVWMRQFKRENIEVSLRVFDEIADSLERFGLPQKPVPAGYHCLDIEPVCTDCKLETGGIPIGPAEINGRPFRFAGQTHTHAQIGKGGKLSLRFPRTRVRDIHLIYGAQTIHKDVTKASRVLEVRLLRAGKPVFREPLLSIKHLCDWWAPLGEHMWAGGGFRHVDRGRVSYALKPGFLYGLFHLAHFPVAGEEADCLEIRALADEKFYLFAATIESAPA